MYWPAEPANPLSASVQVSTLGAEREPVVTIEEFYGDPAALERAGRSATYVPVQGYPGIRARVGSGFMTAQRERVVIYRGRVLHSAVIPVAPDSLTP